MLANIWQWMDISYEHLERFARRSRVPRGVVLESAKEMVMRMRDAWPCLRGTLEISERVVKRIDAQMEAVPIFGARAGSTGAPASAGESHEEIQ